MATSAMARRLNGGAAHAENTLTQNGTSDSYSNSSMLPNLGRPTTEERSVSMNLVPSMGNGMVSRNGDSGAWRGTWNRNGTRDSSRSRDASLLSSNNVSEARTGSTALLQDTDVWRSPWGSNTPSGAHLRSVGASPVRRSNQMGNTQTLLDNAPSNSQYFSENRPTTAAVQRPTNGTVDSNLSQRHSEGMINPFGHHTRSSDESSQSRNGRNSWADAGALQSPTDERRGITSYSASRENSLPSSRNGSEQLNQANEMLSRFGQTTISTNSRHNSSISSLSNGRFPLERQISQQSDYLPNLLSHMGITNEQNGMNQVRPHSSALAQQELYNRNSQNFANVHDEPSMSNGVGSLTAEAYPAFQNPFPQPNSRFSDRGGVVAGAGEFRQSPYHTTATGSQVYDPTYQANADHTQPYANNYDELARRLQNLQQLEPRQRMMHHAPYQPTRMNPQQTRFRSYDAPAQYTLPMPMPGMPLQSTVPMMPQPGMYGMADVPRGPRGVQEAGDRIQSPTLAEYKATYKSGTRRWELKDIYGHVVEFSGDQQGSRFIQQRLETANSEEKEIIFTELLPEVTQLMSDVFGNYVIQKFFEHGDQGQKKALGNKMKTRVYTLSLQMYGCRVVQKALEHVLSDQQAELIQELEPHVLRCIKDQNGNHVIQKAILHVDARHVQFILDSIDGKVGDLANHAYGCRVIQRVLETCVEPAKSRIYAELHACGATLISDQYGNYVAQNMMQHGAAEDRARVIGLVKQNIVSFAKHKYASNVVERCLEDCSPQQRRGLMEELVSKPDSLYQLIKDSFGNYVIQKFLDQLKGEDYDAFVKSLQPEMARARLTVTGKQIAAVDKKMHRHERYDSPNMPPPTNIGPILAMN